MKDSRKSTEFQGISNNSADECQGFAGISAHLSGYREEILTSPAFDCWLERQMQALFTACEEPADPRLIELIRRGFSSDADKVTE